MPICPQCGGQHPGLSPGDILPPDAKVRRAIPAGKEGPPIRKSAFDDSRLSVDLVARYPAETLAAIGATKYIEFEVWEATSIFKIYQNKVVFRCISNNPYHCQVEGKKTESERKNFAAMMTPRLQP
jgi:hypothetical protein